MNALPLLLALLLPASQQEGTRVSAELSQPRMSVGETAVLTIRVETQSTADIHIKLPAFPATVVVTGSQEYSQTQFSIPGGRRRIISRELALQVTAPGVLDIPAIEVEVGGVSYRTRPLRLQVTGSGVRSPGFGEDQAWLRVIISPDTVYVGEQATLTAEAGFSEDIRLRMTRPPIFELPSPTGFWAQDIPGGVRSQLRQVDGRVVEVQSMKRAYFPLSAGRFAFSPARIILDVRQGFLYAPETREIRSLSPRVTVLALPDAGKPSAFRGAVGSYTLSGSVEPQSVAAGEPVQLEISVAGVGNLKAVPPPRLPQILGAEVFAPTEAAETHVEGEVITGTKTFTYVVIPERAGTLPIPPIRFVFFDPAQRAYRELQTGPMSVRVLPDNSAEDSEIGATSLYPIRVEPQASRIEWVRTKWFLLIQLLPLVLFAALWLARRPRRPAGERASYRTRLRAVAELPDEKVYRELDHILRAALRDAAVTHRHDAPVMQDARAILAEIETARFAPEAAAAAQRAPITQSVERVIDALFAVSSHGHASAVLLAGVLAAALADPFEQGREAYLRADYAQAATEFSAHVRRQPADASGWYNLGNAEYRMGNTGHAAWAWASALRLQPRARDIAHNLRAAGAPQALSVRPALALRAEEWLLLAAALWWLTALVVILPLARRRGVPGWVAAPLLLALVCALIGARALAEPRFAVTLPAQATLYSEPTIRSQAFRQAEAGSLVRIVEERNEWLRVLTVDERSAWVARDDVAEIKTE